MRLTPHYLLLSLTFMTLSCQTASPPISRFSQSQRINSLQAPSQRTSEAPPVIEVPSPNYNARPEDAKISAIVLHHTAMKEDAKEVGAFFARPNAKVSAHYIVDRSGYIVRSVADQQRSWHAGRSEFQGMANVNDFSIGIEICNLGDSQEPYSDQQYDGLIRLVAHLVQQYQIPLSRITRHRDVAVPAGRKIDTSNNFSVERVIKGVQALQAGAYQPPQGPPSAPPELPASREISLPASYALEEIADIYLDNPQRWPEIQALNPQLNPQQSLPAGTRLRLPNGLDYYRQNR